MENHTRIEVSQEVSTATRPPKIMVCCLTYSKRVFVIKELLGCLAEQTYPNLEFVILDTSPTSGKRYPELPSIIEECLPRATLLTSTSSSMIPPQVIAEGREQLRQHFLKSDAEYLFFIDDDTIIPPDAITILHQDHRDAVVGVYIVKAAVNGGQSFAASCWREVPADGESVVPVTIDEVLSNRLLEVDLSGLGCALFSRTAIEDVPFAYRPPFTEDFCFFRDLREKGVRVACDTSVKCAHKRYPAGDVRNKGFDFRDHAKG